MGTNVRPIAFVFLALVLALAAATKSASAIPSDDWSSDLTECQWTNNVSTSCSLTMSSPVASMTISGTNTNTTKEQLGSDYAILARQFDSNLPTLSFVTDGNSGRLASITFTHIHNHNAGQAPASYGVQLEFRDGSGTWSNLGSPFTADASTTNSTRTVTAATELDLAPNTAYAVRWGTTTNGAGFSNVTRADFFAVANISVGFRKNQLITVTQAVDGPAGGTTTLAASATSSLPITWGSATPGVCSVSGATASLLATGKCTVTADQAGDAVWVPAALQTMSFNVTPAPTTTASTSASTTPSTMLTTTTTIPAVTTLTTGPVKTTVAERAPTKVTAATATTVASTTTTSSMPAVSASTSTTIHSTGNSDGAVIPSSPPIGDPLARPQRFFRLQVRSGGGSTGTTVTNGWATGGAIGLRPGARVTSTLHSDPVVLGTVTVAADGTVEFDFPLPTNVDPGNHAVIVDSLTSNGEIISAVATFEVTPSGTIENVTDASELLGVTVDQEMVDRSVDSGLPLYDTARNVAQTSAILTTIVITVSAVLTAAGAAVASAPRAPGRPAGRSPDGERRLARREDEEETGDTPASDEDADDSERDENAEGSLSSTDVNLLDDEGDDLSGRGDTGMTWRLRGHERTHALVLSLAGRLGARSRIAARALQDGHWMRAVFGVINSFVWALGAALGVLAAVSHGGMVVAPGAVILCTVIAVSLLDAMAGLAAWMMFTLVAVTTGHVTSVMDVRTLLGLGIVFWALPSIGSAIRPLRRTVRGSRYALFDRVADYAIVPLFLSYASVGVVMSLNGLAGLETVTTATGSTVRTTVFVMAIVRLAAEDTARAHFPARLRATQVDVASAGSRAPRFLTIAVSAALYAMGAAPFFGLGWRTWTVIALISAAPLVRTYQETLPNFAVVNKWFPRGILRSVIMIFFSAWFGRVVLSSADSPQDAAALSVLLLLPALAIGMVDIFAREGDEWSSTILTKVAGAGLWTVSALALTGVITP